MLLGRLGGRGAALHWGLRPRWHGGHATAAAEALARGLPRARARPPAAPPSDSWTRASDLVSGGARARAAPGRGHHARGRGAACLRGEARAGLPIRKVRTLDAPWRSACSSPSPARSIRGPRRSPCRRRSGSARLVTDGERAAGGERPRVRRRRGLHVHPSPRAPATTSRGWSLSQHRGDALFNLYHQADPGNIRDVCVVWGESIVNGPYRKVAASSPARSRGRARSRRRWSQRFASNNHLLPADAAIARPDRSDPGGDQCSSTTRRTEHRVFHPPPA